MSDATQVELIALTQRLLDSIAAQDWATYEQLCDRSITCFEPEARGHLVEGLPFHRFYFERKSESPARNNTISSPHVRVIGDVAIVCYIRLIRSLDGQGRPATTATEETRIWKRQAAGWRLVHLHRSTNS